MMMKTPISYKRGFALIITLSVLTVVIALTGVLIGYLDTARKDASTTQALIQANLYFSDIKKTLSKFKEKKTVYNILYLSPIPLQSEDGRFSLILDCQPIDKGVNINWLGYAKSSKLSAQFEIAQKVYDRIVQKYDIADPERLKEMIVYATQGKSTDLGHERQFLKKNGIISFSDFKTLLTRYQFEVDDIKIGQIPWEKYFVFYPASKIPEENLIAGDYLSVELISLLFDIDFSSLKEEWSASEGALKALLSVHGIAFDKKVFASDFIDRTFCEVTYMYRKNRFAFTFVDEEGEVKDFEFHAE